MRGCVGRAASATAAAIADATAAAGATAATVAAAHPAVLNRLSPKGASPEEAGGRYKRDARCEMGGREPRGAARRLRNEIHGRGWAARWRPSGPGMRLWRRIEGMCAGGRKACRHRHRLPGAGCRLSRGGERMELWKPRLPVRSRKALPLAHTRHLKPICEQSTPTDLQSAPPHPKCIAAKFCLPTSCPSSGQPEARRPEKAAEGAASGVDDP